MNAEQEQKVRAAINALWEHDPWTWGNTCAALLNNRIDFTAPAIVKADGYDKNGVEYIEARFIADGKEFEFSYLFGGWAMGFVTQNNKLLENVS